MVNSTKPVKIKANKKVAFGILVLYFLDLSYRDKATAILLLLNLFFAAIFGIVAVTNPNPISILNWYYLVHVLFVLLLSFRLTTYFLNVKLQDQTLTMIIQQKNRRLAIILALWFSVVICVFLGQLYPSIVIVVMNIMNQASFRYLVVNFIYQSLTSIFLITFLLFITIGFKPQIVSIIFSFLLLSLFVANIPQQLFDNKLNNTNITLKDSQNNPITYKASEINAAFEFYNNVQLSRIKYPHLSKYITDYYVAHNFTISNFDTSENTALRYQMWDALGVLNNQFSPLIVNDSNAIDLKITNITRNSGLTGFAKNDIVTISLGFQSTFNNYTEIQDVLTNQSDEEMQAILTDYINFHDEWLGFYKQKYGNKLTEQQLLQNIWKDNYNLFGGYMTLELDPTSSSISKGANIQNISPTILNSFVFNNYFLNPNAQSDGLIFAQASVDYEYGTNYDALINAIMQTFEMEIYSRLLEDFFLAPVSNYVILTTYDVVLDDNYYNYQKEVMNYQIINFIIFPANLNSVFVKQAQKDWGLFWFAFGAKSTIDFTNQDNYFFSQLKAKFFVDASTGKLSKQLKTVKTQYFIYTQIAFFIFNTIMLIVIFIRKDFK